MNKNAIVLLIAMIFPFIALTAFTPAVSISTGSMPAVNPISKAQPASFSDDPTSTPNPLPGNPSQATDLDTLVTPAGMLCEKAFKSTVKKQASSTPLMTLLKTTYVEAYANQWRYVNNAEQINPLLEATSSENVKTLACVRITRTQTGSYTDGAGAYTLTWTVRLVTWPDGQAIVEKKFISAKPPQIKTGGGDRYGQTPYKEYRQWLLDLYAGDSLFIQGSMVASIAYSPDGKFLAVTGIDYSATVWELAGHKKVFTQPAKAGIMNKFIPLVFSNDNSHLILGNVGAVSVLSTSDWKKTGEVKNVDIWSAALTQDGSRWTAGMSRDYEGVRLYPISGSSPLSNFGLKSPISQVLISPLDKYLVGLVYTCPTCPPSAESGIFVWDFASSQLVQNIKVSSPQSIALLKDGDTLAVALLNNKEIQLYSLTSGTNTGKLSGHAEDVTLLAVSLDGDWLASTDGKGTVFIWDQQTSYVAYTYVSASKVTAIAFSPDGTRLALGSVAGVVELWEFLK